MALHDHNRKGDALLFHNCTLHLEHCTTPIAGFPALRGKHDSWDLLKSIPFYGSPMALLTPMPDDPFPAVGVVIPAPVCLDPLRLSDRWNRLDVLQSIWWLRWLWRMNLRQFPCHVNLPAALSLRSSPAPRGWDPAGRGLLGRSVQLFPPGLGGAVSGGGAVSAAPPGPWGGTRAAKRLAMAGWP